MITEKQFLDAVDIINKYQKQISDLAYKASIIKPAKTPFAEWLNEQKGLSVRLRNALGGNFSGKIPHDVKFVEDMTKRKFVEIRNAGMRSWQEFCDLTGKDYFEWD